MRMRKLLCFFLAAAMVLSAVSCKKEENKSNLLTGYWNRTDESETITPEPSFPIAPKVPSSRTLHFEADGTFTDKTTYSDDSGTWSLSSSKLTLTYSWEEETYDRVYDISSISKSTLVLVNTNFFDRDGTSYKQVETETFAKLE